MSEDLFGDLVMGDLPSVGGGYGQVDPRQSDIERAWKAWTDLTERPIAPVPDRFQDACNRMFDNRRNAQDLMSRVEAAAYVEPHARDPRDLGRVCNAISSDRSALSAIGIMESEGTEVHKWVNHDLTLKMPFARLASILGVDMDDWTPYDYDAASTICYKHDAKEFEPFAENVKNKLGDDRVSPKQALDNKRYWHGTIKATERKGRDAYFAGAKETAIVSELMLDLDKRAERMQLRGVPLQQVAEFHNRVPEGYWEFLDDWIERNPDQDLEDAYDAIKSSFDGFHPDSRKEA